MHNAPRTNAKTFKLVVTFLVTCLSIFSLRCQAQSATNTAFKSGEVLQYDLYYNWQFVWVKAGSASMSITETIYQGLPAYRTRMLTRGSSQADRFFVLRDTLTSIITQHDMLPRYYSKTDMEKESYRQRNIWYTYTNGKAYAKQRYINPKGKVSWKEESDNLCIFDMLSILLRARSFDTSNYKVGHKIKFTMTDGDGISVQTLIYRGKKNIKMKTGNASYRCLVFSFVEYESGKEKEVVTFFVTDDKNHIPVRLDLFLRFGTAKAYIVGSKGVRNPMTAKLK